MCDTINEKHATTGLTVEESADALEFMGYLMHRLYQKTGEERYREYSELVSPYVDYTKS